MAGDWNVIGGGSATQLEPAAVAPEDAGTDAAALMAELKDKTQEAIATAERLITVQREREDAARVMADARRRWEEDTARLAAKVGAADETHVGRMVGILDGMIRESVRAHIARAAVDAATMRAGALAQEAALEEAETLVALGWMKLRHEVEAQALADYLRRAPAEAARRHGD